MDNKNNTKKKVIITILALVLVVVGILFALKGCQKEEPVVHTHSYKINEEGTWICKNDNDILSNTDKPYVAILENNQPKDILAIDSLSKTKINLGNGTIYKENNNIYYSGNNTQTIIIKTQKVDDKQDDKDNLVINAPNDTVYHYGSSTVVSLDAVATNSFHEYGKVDLITLTKARVVLENPSDVKEIYLDINDSNYSYETTIIALKENVELPRLTRDAVDLEEGEVKTLAIVQKLKDEVKTETNTETNEVIETVLEVQTADDDYVKIENVRKSNDELIIEAFLSPNSDETDKTQTETQTTSTITLEEAKEGSSHPASHNTFVPKQEKVTEVVKPTETKEEQKVEETKPVVAPTKKEEVKPVVTPTTEDDTPSTPSHSHSYGNWYDLDATYHAKKCSCGNIVKENHIDENSDNICDVCHHGAVAININTSKYYTDLKTALSKANTNETIELINDYVLDSNIAVSQNIKLIVNQDVELNTNGKAIQVLGDFVNNGSILGGKIQPITYYIDGNGSNNYKMTVYLSGQFNNNGSITSNVEKLYTKNGSNLYSANIEVENSDGYKFYCYWSAVYYGCYGEYLGSENFEDNSTIRLLKDISNVNSLYIYSGDHFSIDLNGYNITFKDGQNIDIGNGFVDIVGSGTISASSSSHNYATISLSSCDVENLQFSSLSVGENVTIKHTDGYGVAVYNKGNYDFGVSVNIDGTIIAPAGFTIVGTANTISDSATHVVFGETSKICSDTNITCNTGIYGAGYGIYTLKGDITANNALSLKSGVYTIESGNYTSKGDYYNPALAYSNGTEPTGAALSITSNIDYAHICKVTVNGGTFESVNGHAVYEGIGVLENGVDFAAPNSYAIIEINGGKFIGNNEKGSVNLSTIENKGVIKGGSFNSNPSAYVPTFGYKINGQDPVNAQWQTIEAVNGKWTVTANPESNAEVSVSKQGEQTLYGTLGQFRDSVNNGDTYSECIVTLLKDIDLSSVDNWTSISTTSDYDKSFAGVFDGNNKTISNMKTTDGGLNGSLFGSVTGTIKNLTLKDANIINGRGSIATLGARSVQIINCHLVNCKVITNNSTGLLLGYVDQVDDALIKECTTDSTSSLTSSEGNQAGGIVGQVCSGINNKRITIEDCQNGANISGRNSVGGIIGQLGSGVEEALINNCVNTGTITLTSTNNAKYVGGIFGYRNCGGTSSGTTNIINCTNSGTVTSILLEASLGGFGGYSNGVELNFTNCVSSGSVGADGATNVAGYIGYYNGGTAVFDNCTSTGVLMDATNKGYYMGYKNGTVTINPNCNPNPIE